MTKSNGSLLTSEEQAICEQIRNSNERPYSQRAQVLLALNEGVSQVKAGELVGLTIGQVRYCLQCFRQVRTAILSTEKRRRMTQDESKVINQLVKPDSTIEDSTSQLEKTEDKKKKDKKGKRESGKKTKTTNDSNKKKKADKKVKSKKSQKKKKSKKAKKNKKKEVKDNKKSSKSKKGKNKKSNQRS